MGSIFDLSGKVALVTGASGGLGLHFARTLSRAGAKVASPPGGGPARGQRCDNQGAGGEAVAVAMDVTEPESVERAVAEVADRLGQATVVVNNSGVASTQTALDLDPADWDRILDTNAKGAWLVAKAAARR